MPGKDVALLSPRDDAGVAHPLSGAMHRLCRRAIRQGLAVAPEALRRQAARVPFSRYHRCLELVSGREQVTWQSVRLEVDPGEVEGFLLYFLGTSATCSEAEINAARTRCANREGVLFDVGANVGALSLAVATACPGLSVVGFEPDPEAADRFRRNLALNPAMSRRLALVDVALGDRDGTVEFFPGGPGQCELGSMIPRAGAVARPTPCVRLDSFCRGTGRYPDIVKIDVEGAELRVLEGMSGLPDDRWPDTILLEVHGVFHPAGPLDLATGIHGLLTKRGYRLFELSASGEMPCRPPQQWPARIHIVAERPRSRQALRQ